MPQVAPISISAQVALQNRLDAVANNVANASTPGFRAGGVRFEALLSDNLGGQTDYVSSANTYISRNAGGMNYTGGTLDVAVSGDAWFGIKTPAGTAYTRDGRFHVDIEGYHTLIFFCVGLAVLIIYTHRANIRRLAEGRESRFNKLRIFHR